MGKKLYFTSFAGGEVTPEFLGQIGDAKFQTGLATCRNFVVLPHGPVQNRAGLEFVREVKDSARAVRLIPFTYSTTQTMVLETGHQYMRFHTQGATLMDGDVPYEIATPYDEADLFALHFVQSADVVTIVHPGYAPRELRRLGALNWELTAIDFVTTLTAPTGVTATATEGNPDSGTPKRDHVYCVTAFGDQAYEESSVSASATCENNIYASGAFNTVTWTAVPDAVGYYVYKRYAGLWAYIGQADDGCTFVDDGITPDLSKVPPTGSNPFSGPGNYPGAVTYYQQRRVFGGTANSPQTLWFTRSGTESNLSYSIPSQDTDGITIRVVAREANTIRHLVPMNSLMALTSAAEWRIGPSDSGALTPMSAKVEPQSYIGANQAQPLIVNSSMIYAAARGGHVRELAYSWQAGGYVTGDTSLRAPHLFDGCDIVDLAYSKAPYPIVWATSTSGKLLGLTYVPEQQIGAWHQHETDGVFESVACVAEGDEDFLYAVVRRVRSGAAVRYVERMHSRRFGAQADAFFVDSGLTYTGEATASISGLAHLEGRTVSILADGAVHPQRVVEGGSIALDIEASTVHVGLPYNGDLTTLPLVMQGVQAYGQGLQKNVNEVKLRVYRSGGLFVGPSFDRLREVKQRTTEPYGSPPNLKTDDVEVKTDAQWGSRGQVFIRQADPLPITLLSMTVDFEV